MSNRYRDQEPREENLAAMTDVELSRVAQESADDRDLQRSLRIAQEMINRRWVTKEGKSRR